MTEYIKKEEVIKLIREDKVEITPNLLTIAMIAAPNGYSAEDCYKAINDTCDRHIKEIRNLPGVADVRPVVLCRDCKYAPSGTDGGEDQGFSLEWPHDEWPEDNPCPCKCEDGWYSHKPKPDFFCANGKGKES